MKLDSYILSLEKRVRELEIQVLVLEEEKSKLEERVESLVGFWGVR